LIAGLNKSHIYGQPIQGVEYTQRETNLWNMLYDKLRPKYEQHGSKQFVENFKILEDEKIYSNKKVA
jgi:hypothetical protein